MNTQPITFRTKPDIRRAGDHQYLVANQRCPVCGYRYPSQYAVLWRGYLCTYCAEDKAKRNG